MPVLCLLVEMLTVQIGATAAVMPAEVLLGSAHDCVYLASHALQRCRVLWTELGLSPVGAASPRAAAAFRADCAAGQATVLADHPRLRFAPAPILPVGHSTSEPSPAAPTIAEVLAPVLAARSSNRGWQQHLAPRNHALTAHSRSSAEGTVSGRRGQRRQAENVCDPREQCAVHSEALV